MKIGNYPASAIHMRIRKFAAAVLCLFISGVFLSARSQGLSFQRERGREMLRMIKSDLEKNYYDLSFHNVDIDARFKEADEMIKKADSAGQVYGIIAHTLLYLDDSHTFFITPSHASRIDYGWQMQAFGERCFVTAVEPGSDAEAKGLKQGDVVESVDGMRPTRENLWMIKYLYYALRPREHMQLTVHSPNRPPHQLDITAKVTEGKRITNLADYADVIRLGQQEEQEARLYRHRFYRVGDDVYVWKMPAFDLSQEEVDDIMDKVRNYKSLILDLRGNGGGAIETLLRMIGNCFDHDVKVGDLTRRKDQKPLVARTRGSKIFKGQLIVLIDNGSGSSSEIFARVIQLEKRGVVLGDRSAGAVMEARHFPHAVGVDTFTFFGVSITEADLVMTDGKSLEKTGVAPDELLIPTAVDVAAGRDPVLTRAFALAGQKVEPDKAGALFPIEWRKS